MTLGPRRRLDSRRKYPDPGNGVSLRLTPDARETLDWLMERTGAKQTDVIIAAILAYRAQLSDDRNPEALRHSTAELRARLQSLDDLASSALVDLDAIETAAGLVTDTGARIDE